MKIYFDNILLNEDEQPVKSFVVNSANLTSSEYAIGAQSAIIRQNKNSRISLNFEIQHAHQSESDAAIFALEHCTNLNCASTGTLRIIEQARQKYSLNNAVLDSIKITTAGHTTTAKYEFIGTVK